MFFTTGCGRWNINKRVAKQFYSAPIVRDPKDTSLEFSTLQLKERMAAVSQESDPVKQLAMRDELISELMRFSDHNYTEFKTRSFTQNAALNTGADITSLGLSAAATIVAGPAGQALSAADTGIKGVQSKVSERFFMNQTMILLITTMDSRRAESRTAIYTSMAKPYAKFQIQEAVGLVTEYHNRGNLVDAMAYLQTTMGNQRATNEVEAAKTQKTK
jgi:hypothetical protein